MEQKVLITAAASGIGLEIARAFSSASATVFIFSELDRADAASSREV